MDSKTISSYFIGYSKHSRGYKFYAPTLKIIFEIGIAQFFEDVKFGRINKVEDITFKEESILDPKLILIVAFNNI